MTITVSRAHHKHTDLIGDLPARRRDALAAARAEASKICTGFDPDSSQPAIGTCVYGPGCLALALAGSFDRAGLASLRAFARDLAHLAQTELVIDCGALTECDPALVRILARLRIQRLVAGARVELHHAPEALAAEIGARPARAYTIRDRPSGR